MKRYIPIAAILLVLAFSVGALQFAGSVSVEAQNNQANAPSAQASPAQTPPAAPGPAGTSKPTLTCSGCHGPGTTRPYLAGEQVHKDEHAKYDVGHHARALQNGKKAATCLDCHTKGGVTATILPASDPQSTIHRANIALTCGKCHGDPAVMQGSGIGNTLFTAYQSSVHANALSRGNMRAAVCTDCHRSHDIFPASNPSSSIFKPGIPQTCGQCHQMEATEFADSVHGQSIARGNMNSPSCTDCHGIHSIRPRADSRQMLGAVTCAKCHEGVRLTREFGVAAGRVSSYEDSYHGLAKRLGSDVVADCASCHGVHNILPSSDVRSQIHPNNLVQTCGQCHPGASENFTSGKIHLDMSISQDIGSVGTRWVRWIYLSLITIVIGGMVLHNALAWRKKAVAKRRHEHRTIVRLTLNQRIQHWLLLTSFILLVLTGFALAYPDSWFFYLTFGINEVTRRIVHRIAAVVMMIVGVYHLIYLFATKEGRRWVKDMLPAWKDVKDLMQNLRYYLGWSKTKPKIARFGYAEKAEYWAVVWGTLIMGLTGLMIWFKLGWFRFLERWWIDIATAIHFYEALLATLAIVVWHFYHVIFDPDVYPINWAFYDGRVSEEAYKEEHELAYEQLKQAEREEEEEEATEEDESERRTKPSGENDD